ncbi:hypothetical protein B0T10DRAFT_145310 [Thelonectria olida]|uniref:Uncharacterized protein n=1 Tax=Thelonectria olida TaxID=1576542 RepID=A0A9P9AHN7_9HYPO|nr:hypothetical protein B0T10DRAFT_145310 [Thelonectria olida]
MYSSFSCQVAPNPGSNHARGRPSPASSEPRFSSSSSSLFQSTYLSFCSSSYGASLMLEQRDTSSRRTPRMPGPVGHSLAPSFIPWPGLEYLTKYPSPGAGDRPRLGVPGLKIPSNQPILSDRPSKKIRAIITEVAPFFPLVWHVFFPFVFFLPHRGPSLPLSFCSSSVLHHDNESRASHQKSRMNPHSAGPDLRQHQSRCAWLIPKGKKENPALVSRLETSYW